MNGFLLLESNIDIWKILTDVIGQMAAVLPNLVGALVVFVIGWILAKIVAKLIKRLLTAIKADALAEKLNEIDFFKNTKFRFVPSVVLSKVAYYFIFLIFILAATDVLGMKAISDLMSDLINYLPNLLTAAVILMIGIMFADFIKNIVYSAAKSLGIPAAGLIGSFVFYFLFIGVAMTALDQARINTEYIQQNLTLLIGGLMLAFAFGYGLASKDMMANFIASFYSRKKIQPGDFVEVDGYRGTVVEIDNTSFTLRTPKGRVIIPLSKLTVENVRIFTPEKDGEED